MFSRYITKFKYFILLFTFLSQFEGCVANHDSGLITADNLPALLQILSPDKPSVYFSSVRNVFVSVYYETGAEPETSSILVGVSNWQITIDNLNAAFSNRGYTVSVFVPTTLSEMTEITPENQATWTIPEILSLAAKYQTATSDYTNARFFLAFVKGYLDNNGSPNPNVVGVNISGTPVTIVFKDVVNSSFTLLQKPRAEQITVVHELGHALGMVNNGVPMVSSHQDVANGHHCSNSTCGMYYSVEGSTGLGTFTNAFDDNARVIFKNECLEDFRNFKP
ncbi:hypothetical protein CH373_11040 [Leptospira perolatii]|uniref:Uncharacterized protein n=1 Tax=Leptospira perolatii TaxID=2023191 RepID=A0A2M9ZLW8_9LEPT|nr:hypothetical protein [Leptospira perolatii]PJZ69758.1 hypothetical protein CH360_09195 [Leptospira perolatii]PJZ73027.1 hypothetical protein CH373_11040 [Leptospira perolatii]